MTATFPAASPAFPTSSYSVCPLETIDFCRLLNKDQAETAKLLAACESRGFFYLDLQGPEIQSILKDHQSVLRFMEAYFALPLDVKMADDQSSWTSGYKPCGRFAGAKENTRDSYETLKLARAELKQHLPLPPSVTKDAKNVKLFERFVESSHLVNSTILARLSEALNLAGDDQLLNFHRDREATNTTLVLLRYPGQHSHEENVGHNKHTDIGSLTLLFAEQWGLQVVSPERNTWEFVRPRDGHAIINVGDSLRFLSKNRLFSCLHRVIPVDDQDRYSIAYFLRPESEVEFEGPEGKKVTAKKWHDDKYDVFGQSHAEQAETQILTGGMELHVPIAA
ncbi:hypothetical protein HDU86_001871 [Geranomyces michiganensis]|nr:hypothetical protein HDU86_001871 [Geranomyces michiganensis]